MNERWARLHDATLESIELHWSSGEVVLRIRTGDAAHPRQEIVASAVRRMHCDRQMPWGSSVSINEVRGPGDGLLEIEMQSGDVLRIEAGAFSLREAESMPPLLRDWFDAVRADALTVRGEREAVANENLWTFRVDAEQRRTLTNTEVSTFLRAVLELWRRQLRVGSSVGWMFYAWHDEMAGQLRFSACPARTLDDLPFGCTLRAVDVDEISREFLERTDVIRWSDLQVREPVPGEVLDEGPRDFVLNVWAERL